MVPHVFKAYEGDAITREQLATILEKDTQTVIGAFDGEDLIGYAHLVIRPARNDPNFQSYSTLYISSVAVDDQRKGQGLGRILMNAIEAKAKEFGCRDVVLDVWQANTSAIGFYEHLGYGVDLLKMSKRVK